MKKFEDRADVRESFEYLLSVKEVRNILGCGTGFVLDLVRDGRLHAYRISGDSIQAQEVDHNTFGIRVDPVSLHELLQSIEVTNENEGEEYNV
jgi:excisionase family DNA binding protein